MRDFEERGEAGKFLGVASSGGYFSTTAESFGV